MRTGLISGLGAALVAVGVALQPATGFAATSGLILGTTYNPTPSPGYMDTARRYYLDPTTSCKVDACPLTPVTTPEEFWPLSGWGDRSIDQSIAIGAEDFHTALLAELAANPGQVVVYGTSQGGAVMSLEKRRLADLPQPDKDRLVFVITGNPNRPNGGLLERFTPLSVPGLGFTFNGATPTNTGIKTVDIAFQYDVIADFPRYPLNPLVWLNMAAAESIHSSYLTSTDGYTEAQLEQAINDPANRQTYGDTVYITIPTKTLPLADLIRSWGTEHGVSTITKPLADLLEPSLRALIELSYDRTTPYGKPAPVGLFPDVNPVKLISDLTQAAQQGIRAAAADLSATPPHLRPRPPRRPSAAVSRIRQSDAPKADSAASSASDNHTTSTASGATKKARGGPRQAAHSR